MQCSYPQHRIRVRLTKKLESGPDNIIHRIQILIEPKNRNSCDQVGSGCSSLSDSDPVFLSVFLSRVGSGSSKSQLGSDTRKFTHHFSELLTRPFLIFKITILTLSYLVYAKMLSKKRKCTLFVVIQISDFFYKQKKNRLNIQY